MPSPDFPRGWTFGIRPAVGGLATITVAAAPGIARVLDNIDARLINVASATTQVDVTVGSTELGILAVTATAGDRDDLTLSGLGIMGGTGFALVVAFGGGVPGCFESLVIQGHDI